MEVLQARIDSFKKQRRVKNPSKSSTVTVRWPHPVSFKANPETLATAGFFYNPSYDGLDSVTCYYCNKELEGWEEDDDPHAIHWKKCGQTCCWAIVRCGLLNDTDKSSRFVFTDKTRVPTHKLMEKARFDTFDVGNGWIHDQVKNHSASSKMMARAGFVYTPQQSNDDLVTCLYCDTSLSGWDADDDPMEEHRRRKKSCPFFSASELALTNRTGSQSQSTKPPSKSKPPTRSTSKSKHQDIFLPTKTHDGELDNDLDSSRPIKVRSRSKSVTRSEPEESNAEGEIQKKSLRSRSKTKAKDSEDVPRKSSRSKAKASRAHEVPPKPSRTRSKTKVLESEPEEEPLTIIKPGSTSQPEPTVYPAPSPPQHSLPQTPKKVITSPPKAVPSTTVVLEAEPPEESEPEVAPIVLREVPAESPHQSQTLENLFNNDTVIENHIPPLSSPSPARQKMNVVEISSDEESPVTQETHGSATAQVTSQPDRQPEVRLVFSQSRKSKRSLTVEVVQPTNRLPSVPTVSPIREIDAVGDIEPEPEPETNNYVFPAPSTPQRSSPQTPLKVMPPLAVQPNNPLLSVPTVSPIREIDVVDDIETEPELETNRHVYPAPLTPHRSLPQTPPKVIPALSKLDVQPDNPLPSVPTVSPIREIYGIAPDPEPEMNNYLSTAPSTPLPLTPPKKDIISPVKAASSTIVELIPALSKLPFIPLQTLTEAELDMTVEEWIRNQMNVEYDEFRRDGERELQRFRNQAEEVRKAIEGL